MKYNNVEEIKNLIPEAYVVEKFENIKAISSSAVMLRHVKTGARVALFINDDENKLFSAAFRTPPVDDCGTPHIIEHCVLCGSEKYPVKEPFMQLVKTSMQTFLNAMTYPDKTIFPVSSCNDTDFVNLSNVYLDAVFAPNISKYEEIFMQEGWHYEPTEDGGLEIGGVVYSEMMGAESSPDSNIYDLLIAAMFPDNTYGRNSGGDPEAIPDLTYEKFLEFYNKHYHPSNAYITLYGNLDFAERLDYIDREYLSKYEKIDPKTEITEQTPFGVGNIPTITKKYPISSEESSESKTFLAYGSVCADSLDALSCVAYDFLYDILVETPGSPVKAALTEAGIGQEIYGGFLNHMRRPVFSVIAKNTGSDRAGEFVDIVTSTLRNVRDKGINRKSLLAAIERSEFRFREGESGSASKGLNVTLSMLQSWLYSDDEPFAYIKADEILSKLRELCDTDYYEKLLDKILLGEHSACLILEGDPDMNRRREAKLKAKLDDFCRDLSEDEYSAISEKYDKYCEYQEREETPEELSCIPLLSKDDINTKPQPLFIREAEVSGVKTVFHDIDTNGLAYVRFIFDMAHVQSEDLPYIDLISSLLGKVDTKKSKYADLLDEIRLATGGFGFASSVYRNSSADGSFKIKFEINLRMLAGKTSRAVELIHEIITDTKLEDTKRIKEILSEIVSEKQRDIVSSGSEFAAARAAAYTSSADACEDYLDGIESYRIQSRLLADYDANREAISNKLKSLISSIFTKDGCIVSIATDDENRESVTESVSSFVASLPEGEKLPEVERLPLGNLNEGFMTSSQVQYVATCGNLSLAETAYSGKYQILTSILKNDYLYPEIRMKGGAYGYTAIVSQNSGNVSLSTYRDPCLRESVDVFKSSGEFIRNLDMTDSELLGHIIGTFGRIDRPMSPYLKAARSLSSYMTGRTYDDMLRDRNDMLTVTVDDIKSFADPLEKIIGNSSICVIGNEAKIRECSDLFDNTVKLA